MFLTPRFATNFLDSDSSSAGQISAGLAWNWVGEDITNEECCIREPCVIVIVMNTS